MQKHARYQAEDMAGSGRSDGLRVGERGYPVVQWVAASGRYTGHESDHCKREFGKLSFWSRVALQSPSRRGSPHFCECGTVI